MVLLNKDKTFASAEKMKVRAKLNNVDRGVQRKDPRMISSTVTMDKGPVDFKSRISEHGGHILALSTRDVFTLPPTASIMEAIKAMTERKFRRVPITDAGTKRLVGIVSSVDIINFLGGGSKNLLIEKRHKGNLLAAINEELKEIMDYNVTFLYDHANFSEALKIMLEQNIGGLPIVNEEKQLVAIFTERNAVELMSGLVTNLAVKEYMTRNVTMATTDTSIGQAAKIMVENGIRRLPVVKDGIFAGMVTASDIVHFLGRGDAFEKLVTGNIHEAFDQPVGAIVSRNLVWTGPETDMGIALEIMLENKIGSLPILEAGIMRGIITERDFLRAFEL
ncbi:MAG: CBS domain-containing protein [Methanosarcinaceae archaeon]|nr:CBS domain-containing protein [Methanosarcinaceae archaeon]